MGGGKKWFGSSLREQHAYVSYICTCAHQLTDGNKIGDEGATALAAALEKNGTLESLKLCKMMIHVW